MRRRLGEIPEPDAKLRTAIDEDASGVGVNYADAVLATCRQTLDDGRKVAARRRGLKITLTLGDAVGEGLLRREHGPEPHAMLLAALREAAAQVGADVAVEDDVLYLAEGGA